MPPKPDQGSAERLRAILQTAVEGIITIDETGIIESANPAAEKIFGYSSEELFGQKINILMPSPYREEHDGYLENYHATGHAKIIGIGRELVGQRKDGSQFPMELSVSEVSLPNQRIFTGFVRDITERNAADQQLKQLAQTLTEKNRELETIVYVASHDLRSPLVNIQGFSRELAHACEQMKDLLLQDDSPQVDKATLATFIQEDIPEAMSYIQAGVARMDALLSGFLRFSRLGHAVLHRQDLEMNPMIDEILKSMDYQIQQAGAQVQVSPLPDCHADAIQIGQVFTNLIDNSLKYRSPDRPCHIQIRGTRQKDRVRFEVEDNGMGISPQYQKKVFEVFHRLSPNDSQGEGLGLSIAQRIVERHNGQIELDSQENKGTTFFVSLTDVAPSVV